MQPPRAAYFNRESHPAPQSHNCALADMYLAEDRILCFELVAREQRRWVLHYTSNSVAETDTPGTLLELIKQRRRWLNGSLFALVYYLIHCPRFLRTKHSVLRKIGFVVQASMQVRALLNPALTAWQDIAVDAACWHPPLRMNPA